jgi:O-antigen/teichoic acid export membrane protein
LRIKEQAVTGMLWMGGYRFGTQIIDQTFTIILVRLLAPSDFGLMAMVAVFTTLFFVFADMGLASPALIQRLDLDEEYLSTAFWSNFVGGLVLCAIALGGGELIARFYAQPLVHPVFAALSLRFVFAGASATQLALLQRQMRFSTFAWRNVWGVVLGGAVGIGLALLGAGVWSLVGQAVSGSFFRAVLLWVTTPWRPRRLFSWEKFRHMWNFGVRVLGSRIFGQVVKQADNLMIGRVYGAQLLGYYAFAYGLFLGPLVDISIVVGRVAFAALARLQQDVERVRRGYLLTVKYISLIMFPALLGALLVAHDLVAVVFGPKWLPAVPVLRVLLIAGLLQSHSNMSGSIFMAMGKPDWLLKWSFASACLYVPAFFIGLRWGIVGVAVGYTVSTVILIPVQVSLIQRLLRMRLADYFLTFTPFAAAAAVMGVCVYFAQAWLIANGVSVAPRLAASIAVGMVSYAAAVMLLQRNLIRELRQIIRGVRRPSGRRSREGMVPTSRGLLTDTPRVEGEIP